MSAPRVSVCVPVYNGAAYLDECLATIAAQTFGDYEVLVVDDCSSDDSVAIARRHAASDPRIRVHVNEVNRGLVGNWNRCIDLAAGEWIKFLFQDDLIEPDCLEAMLAAGEAGGGFVACSRHLLFEGSWDETFKSIALGHKHNVDALHASRKMTAEAYCMAKVEYDWNIVGEPSVTLIRRHLFDDFGRFDPLLVQICDSEMWSRLATHVGVDFVARPLVTFRVHAASTTESNRAKPFRSMILDGIIESWKFCESPQFARMREIVARAGALQTLKEQLETKLHIAFYMVRDAERASPPDPTVRSQIKAVLDQLGGFRRARNRHLLFRFKRMVGLSRPVP